MKTQKGLVAWFVFVLALVIIGAVIFFTKKSLENGIQDDAQRINDLISVKEGVVKFWQSKGSLPENLDELSQVDQTYILPRDPASKDQYVYEALDSDNRPLIGMPKFKLCTEFASSNTTQDLSSGELLDVVGDEHWDHPKGFFCYIRIINNQSFPLKK